MSNDTKNTKGSQDCKDNAEKKGKSENKHNNQFKG